MIKILLFSLAFSYIPHSQFILKKSAETHGKGSYRILQEVIFQSPEDRVVVQETWWVTSGEQMYLEAKGPQISYAALYEEQTKYFPQANNKVGSSKVPAEFFEGFFHYRSSSEFAKAILRSGITSREILTPQRRYGNLKDIEYKGQSFVRLARTSGTTTYAFGNAVTGDATNVPALWIEQDTFRVRRLRFKTGSELTADEYELYSNGLEYPRTRVMNVNGDKVTIRTLSITAMKPEKSHKEMLNQKAKQDTTGNNFAKTAMGEKIQKFYQDFR